MSTKTDTSHDASGGAPEEAERELGEAGSRLSTVPKEEVSLPSLGPVGWARWFWRQLTSMRVALLLLFLLSLGAIPGSLIPQISIDPVKVEQFKDRHDVLAPIYDRLGLFNVYSSVWFSAIYLLLFVSLIGCIVPRTWQFVGQLRGRPPGAPRRLTRLPAYTTWRTEAEPEEVLKAARAVLRKRRFRTRADGVAVASEKGYLREAGNLVFHIALIVMLVAFGVGSLWKSEGGKLIAEGDGFANSLTQYDDFKSGPFFDSDHMEPFGFTLDDFESSYERSGPQKGTPRTYRAHVTYFEGADGERHRTTIEVNRPLDIAGSKVFLISTGYAPIVTVKDGRGKKVYGGAVPFLQQDANLTSTGVIKVPGARTKDGKPNQLGFQGFFVPTFGGRGTGSMFSQFPALDYPVLTLTAYHGDLGVNSGLPQNVYQLQKKNLRQYKDDKGKKVARMMLPGETMELPNGDGTITFEGVKQWASFQISHQPGNGLALAGAVAALVGLAASLFVQRRRVWVRAEAGPDGVTVVELAGLGRSESARLPEELAGLAEALRPHAPMAPPPDPNTNPARDTGPARRTATEPGAAEGEAKAGAGTRDKTGAGPGAQSQDAATPPSATAHQDSTEPPDSADPADHS